MICLSPQTDVKSEKKSPHFKQQTLEGERENRQNQNELLH